jgi:hypothetical protein
MPLPIREFLLGLVLITITSLLPLMGCGILNEGDTGRFMAIFSFSLINCFKLCNLSSCNFV